MNQNHIDLIILDRDGTINIDKEGYTHKVIDCELYEDVITFFSKISLHIKIVVVTNQSGIARNYYSISEFEAFNHKINQIIKDKTNHPGIIEFFYCPHLPNENCKCRKPKSYLVEKAIKKYNSNTDSAILIGDKSTDIEAGSKAGIRSYLIKRDKNINFFNNDLLINRLDEIIIKNDLYIPLR